jgi:hypothetical protein
MKYILPKNSVVKIDGLPCSVCEDAVIESGTPLDLQPFDVWIVPRVLAKMAIIAIIVVGAVCVIFIG